MTPLARFSVILSALIVSVAAWPAAEEATLQTQTTATILWPPPDPCIGTHVVFNPPPWPSLDLVVMGQPARLFEAGPSSNPGDPPRRHNPSQRPLVLVVDGNGFSLNAYNDLAGYLAEKGFNVVVIDRPSSNGPNPVQQATAAIAEAFDTLGLPDTAPVAVIGHSVGGAIAIDTVVQNAADPDGYDIRAVVLLAPKVGNGTSTLLAAQHVGAMLTVYGSQDNDVGGLGAPLTDGFAAYDRSGTESSTTCHQPFCMFQAEMHRMMVYVHGADHSGLVNQTPGLPQQGNAWDPYNNYLSRSNQFCVAKAYTLAMLEWTLDSNTSYTSMVHGQHVPASIQAMKTAAPDEFGNPAGSPVRIGLQVSPKKRSVIENFEDGAWSIASQTPMVVTQVVDEGDLAGGTMNIRHASRVGLVGWPQHNTWQFVGMQVPAGRRNLTGFSRVALRLGQLAAVGDPALANPPNASQSLLVGLHDGSSTSWVSSAGYGDVLPADRRPNGQHQSVMSTLNIPLTAFSGINKSAIVAVYLAFPAGSQGTLLVDSVEWFKP